MVVRQLGARLIVKNEGSTPTVLQSYWRDMTANGPEYRMLDTSIPNSLSGFEAWTDTNAAQLTHVGTAGQFGSEFFRTGHCPGFFSIAHIIYAAWSTDMGQRIGAACEVEGGCGGAAAQLPPAKPTGLKLL